MTKEYFNLPYKKIFLYRPLAIISLMSIGVLLFVLVGSSDSVIFNTIEITLLWGLLVYLIPLLILFFNYRKENRKVILKVKNQNITYYKSNSTSLNFKIKDINKVVLNQSFTLYHNNIRLFFWDEYYYALIELQNKQKIIISCLLCDELKKFIPSNLIIKKRRLFPLIDLSFSSYSTQQENENNKRVNVLMSKFKSKSQEELENIILNEGSYQKEAVEAARNLLKSRSTDGFPNGPSML